MAARRQNRSIKVLVGILVVLFGAGSWLTVNGLWVELPLLVALGIPEGYNLASYLVIITQMANVAPVIFTITSRLLKTRSLEVYTIYLTLSAAAVSCLLLIFFWDVTTFWSVFDGDRSTALLSLAFVIALVNCTSSVTFIPFMVRLKSSYMTLLFVGQGVSALAPGLVALAQGVGQQACVVNSTFPDPLTDENCTIWRAETIPANFPPEIFFLFLTISMILSLVAFLLLDILPLVKGEYSRHSESTVALSFDMSRDCDPVSVDNPIALKEIAESKIDQQESIDQVVNKKDKTTKRSKGQYVILFTILGTANALSNSVFPSLQSYSCGAYGFDTYLLAATLGQVAQPIACFVVMFAPQSSLVVLAGTLLLGLLAGGYCLATALLSPAPPLQDELAGTVLVIIAWILVGGVFAHVKATIGWILRNEPDNHRLLTWYGVFTQMGSLVGAFTVFPLVNFTSIFVPFYSDPCEGYPTCE